MKPISLVFLNPPYDGQTMPPAAVSAWNSPSSTPAPNCWCAAGSWSTSSPRTRVSEKIARHLAGWYEDLRCFRFAGDDYERFKQVVIFGVRRRIYQQPGNAAIENIRCWARGEMAVSQPKSDAAVELLPENPIYEPLGEIHTGNGEYRIPASPLRGPHGAAFSFKFAPVSLEDYMQAAERAAQVLEQNLAWKELIPETEPLTITPAITPKLGHVSMQVSGGLLGTNLVSGNDGRGLLIKGGTEKFTVRVDDEHEDPIENYDPDDPAQRKKLFRVRVEERSRPVLFTLDEDGRLVFLNQPDAIRDVLREHVGRLARQLEERNIPRYDRHPEPWEWQLMAPLSPRRHLPGRDGTGLTAPQKHFSIALGRLLLAQGTGIIGLEMGGGKSTIALAVAEYIQAALARSGSHRKVYPVMIVGPGIVTGDENWPKEVRDVIPGATSRVVDIAARPLPKPVRIAEWARIQGIYLDEKRFEGLTGRRCWEEILAQAARQSIDLHPTTQMALRQSLRRAQLNPPARRKGAHAANLLDARIGGYLWMGQRSIEAGLQDPLPRDPNHAREVDRRYSLVQFLQEYRTGVLPEKSFAILSYETAKLGSGRVPAMPLRRMRVHVQVDGRLQKRIIFVCTCPGCGRVISEEYDEQGQPLPGAIITPGKRADQFVGARRRFCQALVPHWIRDPETGKYERQTHDSNGRPFLCNTPLFSYNGLRREAAARYVQRKARRAFPLFAGR